MAMEPTIVSGEQGAAVGEQTQVVGPGPEATQAAIVIACPVCQTQNPPGERWCRDCGFLLASAAAGVLEMPELAPSARLVGEGGREYPLQPGVNTIGREGTDVLLLDATVSRRHARLTLEDGQVWVEDEGSTNGTRVGGQPVPAGERRSVRDGDELRFGSVALRLALPEGFASAVGVPEEAGEEREAGGSASVSAPVYGRLVAADGTEHLLREGTTTAGRRSENDLVIANDPYVSGRHAEFVCGPSGCVVTDVGSTNGSFLRDARLPPHEPQTLAAGDELRMGRSVFIFEAVTPTEEPGAADEATDAVEHAMEDDPQMTQMDADEDPR
jgi:pSer/pThr/pTyr-binding forkhead associated (FHA) protein